MILQTNRKNVVTVNPGGEAASHLRRRRHCAFGARLEARGSSLKKK
jgi:hypothetical protein